MAKDARLDELQQPDEMDFEENVDLQDRLPGDGWTQGRPTGGCPEEGAQDDKGALTTRVQPIVPLGLLVDKLGCDMDFVRDMPAPDRDREIHECAMWIGGRRSPVK